MTFSVTTNDTEDWLHVNSAIAEGTRPVNTANGGNMTVEMVVTATDPNGLSTDSNVALLNIMHNSDPEITALPDHH